MPEAILMYRKVLAFDLRLFVKITRRNSRVEGKCYDAGHASVLTLSIHIGMSAVAQQKPRLRFSMPIIR
jgi:hypothetical protein